MGVKLDLAGKIFGRLTAIEFLFIDNNKGRVWECQCICGKKTNVRASALKNGRIQSCGCLKSLNSLKHGKSSHGRTPEYEAWQAMIARCYCPTNKKYRIYGGRGIIVCDRWLGDDGFVNFLEDMGERPSPEHSLDRFPDKNGNYFKENCRWATIIQQNRNTNANRVIEYNGERLILIEWAEKLKMHKSTLLARLKMNWSVERIVNTPVKKRKK